MWDKGVWDGSGFSDKGGFGIRLVGDKGGFSDKGGFWDKCGIGDKGK